MQKFIPALPLNNGSGKMPQIAYGTGTTWFSKDDDPAVTKPINRVLVDSIKTSIKLGFRHLDGAEMYNTERELGQAIKEATTSGLVTRDELFVTSKVLKGSADVPGAARRMLDNMQLDKFDLFLLHAPFLPEGLTLKQVWSGMESLVDSGVARSIGVSNFRVADLQQLLCFARIKPVVNQFEYHAYLQQPELCAFCQQQGIIPVGYSSLVPLIHSNDGPVDPVVQQVAASHGKTPEQVLVKWALQKGHGVVTTSHSEARLAAYLQAAAEPGPGAEGAFTLSAEEVARIDAAGQQRKFRKFWVNDFGPDE